MAAFKRCMEGPLVVIVVPSSGKEKVEEWYPNLLEDLAA